MSQKKYDMRQVKNQKYAYCLYIDIIDGEEKQSKTVVPMRWLDSTKNILWWPKGSNVLNKEYTDPDDTWDKFQLLNILVEGDKTLCEDLLSISSSNEGEKNEKNKKSSTDFEKVKSAPAQVKQSMMSVLRKSASSTERPIFSSSPILTGKSLGSNNMNNQALNRESSKSPIASSRSSRQHSRSRSRSPCMSRSDARKYRSRSREISRTKHFSRSRSRYSRSLSHSPSKRLSRSRSRCSNEHPRSPLRRRSPNIPSTSRSHSASRSPSPSSKKSRNSIRKDSAQLLRLKFPMEVGEYQRLVLTQLYKKSSTSNKRDDCTCPCTCGSSDNGDNEGVEKICTMEDFFNLEEKLKNKDNFDVMVRKLKRYGGKNIKDITKNIMTRLLSKEVMSKFNLTGKNRGNANKRSFRDKNICSVVVESVRQQKNSSECEIKELIGEVLKYAPFRKTDEEKEQDINEESGQ